MPNKNKKSKKDNDGGDDWLASLARQAASADSKTAKSTSKRKRKGGGGGGGEGDNGEVGGGGGGDGNNASAPLTKAQRIERREQKKAQREERKRLVEEKRLQRLAKKRQTINHGSDGGRGTQRVHQKSKPGTSGGMTATSKRALTQLSTALDTTISSHSATNSLHPKKRNKKNKKNEASDEQEPQLINGLPLHEPKGKATKHSTLRHDSKELQPRIRDYNGQGLVRPSLFLDLKDPSFVPKLELEFEEHVEGFFGKAKQKAAKKQSDKNMLWRRCLKAKEEDGGGDNGGGGGKKKKRKKNVGLDEKVEGMMKQGIM